MSVTQITDAQARAIQFLGWRNGRGVIDRYGRVLAAGETGHFDPATFLRLIAKGFVHGGGDALTLTEKGERTFETIKHKEIAP